MVAPACFEACAAGRDLVAATVRNRVVRLPALSARVGPARVPAGPRATSRAASVHSAARSPKLDRKPFGTVPIPKQGGNRRAGGMTGQILSMAA